MTPDLEGAKVFRAAIVLSCVGLALWAILIGGIGSWLGAW